MNTVVRYAQSLKYVCSIYCCEAWEILFFFLHRIIFDERRGLKIYRLIRLTITTLTMFIEQAKDRDGEI